MSRKLAPMLLLTATACAGAGIVVEPGGGDESFVVQVVESGNVAGPGVALATDADGNPHLSYLVLPEEPAEGETAPPAPVPGEPLLPAVSHAHLVERSWTKTAVAEEQRVGEADETAIVVAADGTHHVAWTANGALLYASNAGGEFSESERVVSGASGISIAVDGDGNPWIAFYVSGAGGPENGTDLVRVATPADPGWTLETAAEASIPEIPGTGIGVTADGPVVAYGSEGTTYLARRTGQPFWDSERADGDGGSGVALSVDGDGNPHLAYLNAAGGVRHAHSIDGAAWEASEVGGGAGAGPTTIAVGADGVHHVAWQAKGGRIAYATNEGGAFAEVELSPSTNGGVRPRLAAGREGAVYLAWHDPAATSVKLGGFNVEEPLLAAPPGGAGEPAEPTDGATDGPPPCEPSGTELSIVAKDIAFDTDCLAAPAGEAFTMAFDNQDTVPHNVAIYEAQGGASLFQGETFPGPESRTYDVPAIEEGQYYFQCDVHPDMNGTFVSG